jgi:hypothetical protein
MKNRLFVITVTMLLMVWHAPAMAFLDYLFGGDSSRGAVENSAIGDLRAWYTGNPIYQFNPYYSNNSQTDPLAQPPGLMPQQQQPSPSQGATAGAQPQPSIQYVPPQGPPQAAYGYGQPGPAQQYGGQYQPQYQPQAQPQYQPQAQPQYQPQAQPQYQQQAPAYQNQPMAQQPYQQMPMQGAPAGQPQGYYGN